MTARMGVRTIPAIASRPKAAQTIHQRNAAAAPTHANAMATGKRNVRPRSWDLLTAAQYAIQAIAAYETLASGSHVATTSVRHPAMTRQSRTPTMPPVPSLPRGVSHAATRPGAVVMARCRFRRA